MTLRVLIVDDESLNRERLRHLLLNETQVEILGECADGTEALKMIREKSPDVVFLDIKLPELDGFGVLEKLHGTRQPAIVFVTAHDQFALRAFEFNAADYLVKPFDHERFQKALARVRERIKAATMTDYASLLGHLVSHIETRPKRLERVTVKSGFRTIWIKPEDIDWISAADNYVELHLASAVHFLRTTMTAIEKQLPEDRFVRISRSHLVNVDRIKELRSRDHGDYLVLLDNDRDLTGTRNFRAGLERVFGRSR